MGLKPAIAPFLSSVYVLAGRNGKADGKNSSCFKTAGQVNLSLMVVNNGLCNGKAKSIASLLTDS